MNMLIRTISIALLSIFTHSVLVIADQAVAEVYKSADCSCCQNWVSYMEDKGFTITTHNTEDITQIKSKYNIPEKLISCHTAIINSYVVEGHVPIEAIEKLLHEKPNIAGIAVPGMPEGSPGMGKTNLSDYKIYSFNHNGNIEVFLESTQIR